jgi:hypothetical protein
VHKCAWHGWLMLRTALNSLVGIGVSAQPKAQWRAEWGLLRPCRYPTGV